LLKADGECLRWGICRVCATVNLAEALSAGEFSRKTSGVELMIKAPIPRSLKDRTSSRGPFGS